MCQSTCWCYYWHFPHFTLTGECPSHFKTWLLPCGSHPHSYWVLEEIGSPSHQRQHPCQTGPSPVCFQNQQIHRSRQINCPPLCFEVPTEEELLHQNAVSWLQPSIQHNFPHKADWKTKQTIRAGVQLTHHQPCKQRWEFILGGNQQSSRVCTENNLLLNISKTKELTGDFWKKEAKTQTLVYMSGAEVEQVNSSLELPSLRTFHGHHTSPLWLKKAQKSIYFLIKPTKPKSVHPADKRYRSICCHTTRLWSSFIP